MFSLLILTFPVQFTSSHHIILPYKESHTDTAILVQVHFVHSYHLIFALLLL